MDLRELLGEELHKQVIEKTGEKHKVTIVSDGNWIPKEKFDSANEEKKQYKGQVDNLNTELGKLQAQLKDNEKATETINSLKQQIEKKEADIVKVRNDTDIQLAIKDANAKNVKAVQALLKLDTVERNEDGTVKGLDDQLKSLMESDPYLFDVSQSNGTGGSKGNGGRSSGGSGGDFEGIGQKLAEMQKQTLESVQATESIYFK